MAKFTVNSDAVRSRISDSGSRSRWDGQYVAGLNKCSALKRTTEVTPWYEGGDSSGPHQIPGKTKYDRDHAGGRGHPRHQRSRSGPTR